MRQPEEKGNDGKKYINLNEKCVYVLNNVDDIFCRDFFSLLPYCDATAPAKRQRGEHTTYG
jgi:hypothetical protein